MFTNIRVQTAVIAAVTICTALPAIAATPFDLCKNMKGIEKALCIQNTMRSSFGTSSFSFSFSSSWPSIPGLPGSSSSSLSSSVASMSSSKSSSSVSSMSSSKLSSSAMSMPSVQNMLQCVDQYVAYVRNWIKNDREWHRTHRRESLSAAHLATHKAFANQQAEFQKQLREGKCVTTPMPGSSSSMSSSKSSGSLSSSSSSSMSSSMSSSSVSSMSSSATSSSVGSASSVSSISSASSVSSSQSSSASSAN